MNQGLADGGQGTLKIAKNRNQKDWWDKFGILAKAVGPLATALLVLIIGFGIKDSVDFALRQRQLEISSAQGMQEMIAELHRGNLTKSDAEAAATALAAFGPAALLPLVNVLSTGAIEEKLAAGKGLFLIGISHPEPTCQILESVLKNRNQQFSWSTHRSVIRLLGQINCRDAIDSLKEYQALVRENTESGLKAYRSIVLGQSPPELADMDEVEKEVDRALGLLSR